MKRYLLSALTLSLLAGVAGVAGAADVTKRAVATSAQAGGPSATLVSGIAIEYVEPSVRAQDDFYKYLNGKWLATTEIPADKASWGSYAKLRDDTQPQLRGIIEAAAANANRGAGADAQKIGDFYASFMDEAKLEQLGLAPLKPELDKVAALQDKKEIPALLARIGKMGVSAPCDFIIHQDAKDSTKYVVDFGQGGLGLPDRDYYLEAAKADTRTKYLAHVEKMLSMAGDANAAANAKDILALETE
ncbi:putative metalloendopeptidase, partial [Oxalobacteraceae bacterium GrIS 1.11]